MTRRALFKRVTRPRDGDTLLIPAALAGIDHACDPCPDPAGHVAARRLSDCFCVCGRVYGCDILLRYSDRTQRWYHDDCLTWVVAHFSQPTTKGTGHE